MDLDNISFEELDKKIEAQQFLHSYITGDEFEKLKDQLAILAERMKFKTAKDLIDFEKHPSMCGCLGPRDGFTLCPCAMYNALDNYRFHLAKYLKAKQENL